MSLKFFSQKRLFIRRKISNSLKFEEWKYWTKEIMLLCRRIYITLMFMNALFIVWSQTLNKRRFSWKLYEYDTKQMTFHVKIHYFFETLYFKRYERHLWTCLYFTVVILFYQLQETLISKFNKQWYLINWNKKISNYKALK